MLDAAHVFPGIKALGEQLRLNLRQPPNYRREAFVVSTCNADAVARIDAWPRWPAPVLALIGSAGSGKTHLARAWAARSGAAVLTLGEAPPEEAPVLLDDVDRETLDERLFHLLNRADDPRRGVLLTGRTPPRDWPTALPDLRSRLNALPVAVLGDPDDGVLEGALRRLFEERVITPAPDLIAYLRSRIERSVPAAEAIVERLEAEAAARRRPINRALAREVLAMDEGGD